jgi:drug/metabolite transporter superfamily protein YnfA
MGVNAGGMLGGMVSLAVGVLILVLFFGPDQDEAYLWAARVIVAIGGSIAIISNALWAKFVDKQKPEPKQSRDRQILP